MFLEINLSFLIYYTVYKGFQKQHFAKNIFFLN